MNYNDRPIYLTTNKGKFEEAQHIFKDMYGFDIEIKRLETYVFGLF